MTIDDVMSLVVSLEVDATYYDEDDDASVKTIERTRAAVRAAILALLDAEAEACAKVCEAEDVLTTDYCAAVIRARIAARKSESWEHLKPYGYAPGNYMRKCHRCGNTPTMDKRAMTCRSCAEAMHAARKGGAND